MNSARQDWGAPAYTVDGLERVDNIVRTRFTGTDGGIQVADFASHAIPKAEQVANARLFIAAPALASALRGMIRARQLEDECAACVQRLSERGRSVASVIEDRRRKSEIEAEILSMVRAAHAALAEIVR